MTRVLRICPTCPNPAHCIRTEDCPADARLIQVIQRERRAEPPTPANVIDMAQHRRKIGAI